MTIQDRARAAYATALEAQGPAWKNTADSVRAGFSNVWIGPAIAALEGLLRHVPDDQDADDEGPGA